MKEIEPNKQPEAKKIVKKPTLGRRVVDKLIDRTVGKLIDGFIKTLDDMSPNNPSK